MKIQKTALAALTLAVTSGMVSADIVHNDDVIITFSLCIGNDCVSGESFGFDTMRLKENNLRIHFDDTSSSASFPRNDWRIIVNDSSNGGDSYFGVEDSTAGRRVFTLEAGAPSHSLYMDDGGRIGFGTSTPVTDLHVKSGNTPTLRLEQDGSSGFTPQTWDVAGNEANFFVRDVTNGSALPFKIKPGADTSSLFIAADGAIGMGTESPDFQLEVEGSSEPVKIVAHRTDQGGVQAVLSAGATKSFFGSFSDHETGIIANNVTQMWIDQDGDITMVDGGGYDGTWNPASSREIKDDIKPLALQDAMDALEALEPVQYVYKTSRDEGRIGFIAEDVPALVATNGRKNLSTMDLVAVLTKVVQQQRHVIEQLNTRVDKMETESRMRNSLARLDR